MSLTKASTIPPEKQKEKAAPAGPWTVLLAGGEGRRLSGFVRRFHADGRPKQFATIIGSRSLVQHTYDRALRHSAPSRVLAVFTAGQESWAREQLPRLCPRNRIVLPRNLDTGAAVCMAVAHIAAREPDGRVLILPTDHFVHPEAELEKSLSLALTALEKMREPRAVLLAVRPTEPREGLGWILPGDVLRQSGGQPIMAVRGFVEKPSRLVAERLYAEGALWNTLILAARPSYFLDLFWKHVPRATSRLLLLHRLHLRNSAPVLLKGIVEGLSAFNFSRQIIERAPESFAVVPLENVVWSDWGTPSGVLQSIETMGWEERMRKNLLPEMAASGARPLDVQSGRRLLGGRTVGLTAS